MNFKDLLQFVESRKIFSPADTILLAVSGGIDSVVLVDLFHKAKFRFAIAHCNFSLRGNDSDEDAEFVQRLAMLMHVPFFTEKFDTSTVAQQNGISIQMAARDLRYAWFEKIRQENSFDYVATAHHLDDQVETFLINLIRGTGIAGLHGIPVKNRTIIRPLMFAYRNDIMQYANHNLIGYRADQSNTETKYLRNKLRHEVIPLLCTINLHFAHGLTETIRRISEFELIGNRTLQDWRHDVVTTDGTDQFIDINCLLKLKPIGPYAWELLSPFNFNETQISDLLNCLEKESRKIFHSTTHRIIKDRGRLVISLHNPKKHERSLKILPFAHLKRIRKPLALSFERINDVKNYEIPATINTASLDFDKLQFPLTIRKWQAGDTFFPLGMKKKKKLSDFFIDQKFTLKEKEQTWLLCSGDNIAWIISHRIDHRFRVTTSTREILRVVNSEQ